jgi:hypothetical protein
VKLVAARVRRRHRRRGAAGPGHGLEPPRRGVRQPGLPADAADPAAGLDPSAIVWLGLGDAAKVLVIWFAAFVPSVINSYTGVRSIEPPI